MRRDILELADDSLFIERLKGRFAVADAGLLIRAHALLCEKACAGGSTASKAAALLIEQDANAVTVAAALLPHLLWIECLDPSETRERFGSTVATPLEDLSSTFIPTADDRQLRQRDLHVITEDDRCLRILLAGVRGFLDNIGIQSRVQGSTKGLQGMRRKLARTGKHLQSIKEDYNGKKLLRNS